MSILKMNFKLYFLAHGSSFSPTLHVASHGDPSDSCSETDLREARPRVFDSFQTNI